MLTQKTPSLADLRAEIARKRVKLYHIAPDVGLNPTHIGRMLNGVVSMSDRVRDRLVAILQATTETE